MVFILGLCYRNQLMYIQNKAIAHTNNDNLDISKLMFGNKSDISGPPKSPDLNPPTFSGVISCTVCTSASQRPCIDLIMLVLANSDSIISKLFLIFTLTRKPFRWNVMGLEVRGDD